MKHALKTSALSLVSAASLIGAAAWSTESHACAAEPLVSSVCIMATPGSGWSNLSGFVLARGQTLTISQYQALFSIVGATWGGDGRTTFGVPNLAGRVVMGAGTSPVSGIQYVAGATNSTGVGGAESVSLSIAQLPMHNHGLSSVTVDISKMTATTTLSGLTTTTDLAGVPFSASGSALTLNVSSAQGGSGSPTPTNSSYLSSTPGGQGKIYGTTAPDTALKSGTISGSVSGTLSGTAPGTVSGGSAVTTIGGTAGVSGTVTPTGSSAAVSLMQPYLVMNYYVAVSGIYPSRD